MSEDQNIARNLFEVPVEKELQDGFLAYSLSVIHSRAIPDIRDGLKPVQRRILYGMYKQKLRSDTPHKKSARVVGDVMGKYHPHGDAAIYDALVRLGQGFAMQMPLVDPHGNFGSLDDAAAASRYTECRLSRAAESLIGEIEEGTVDFRPNYDGEETEPAYMPGGFPNLLVNGTSGIAVGMATSIPPHNLVEVAKAVKLLLDNPEATLRQVMKVLPAPDFPGGGQIVFGNGITEAYQTGKGNFRLRAKMDLTHTGKRHSIVVTELPHQVGPERVITKISELVRAGRIDTIADVQDLSDRSGIKIVIDLKAGANPQQVLVKLCKLTPLEETVSINAIALVDGEPKALPLMEILNKFIEHRLDVIVRRSQFRLDKAETRAHLVEGLVIALGNIDEVVKIIRGAKDTNDARTKLCKRLKLTEAQADHILDMQLRRLSRLEADKLKTELAELKEKIKDLKDILAKPARQRLMVGEELEVIAKEHGVPRKTTMMKEDLIELEEAAFEVTDEPTEVTLSDTLLIGRTPQDGWKGRFGVDDLLLARVECRTTSVLTVITPEGVLGRFGAIDAPEIVKERGTRLGPLAGVPHGPVAGILGPIEAPATVVLVTEKGVIKRLSSEEVGKARPGSTLIKLQEGDRVVSAFTAVDENDTIIITSDAQLLRTNLGAVRPQGRTAGGVAGMRLKGDAKVIGAWRVAEDDIVVVAASNGKAKFTPANEYPVKGRGGSGVRCCTLGASDTLAAAWVGSSQQLAARNEKGIGKIKPTQGRRDAAGKLESQTWTTIGVAR